MKYKIYKLIYNNEVIYVGRTKRNLKQRFNNTYRFIPIEIKKESSIELIEETDNLSREEYWRLYYINLGYNLYNKRKGDGIDRKEYEKEYYKVNKNRIKRYKLDNKEHESNRNKLYGIKYRLENPDKVKEFRNNWRKENPDKVKEQKRNWYKNNKESIRKKQKEYRNDRKNKN